MHPPARCLAKPESLKVPLLRRVRREVGESDGNFCIETHIAWLSFPQSEINDPYDDGEPGFLLHCGFIETGCIETGMGVRERSCDRSLDCRREGSAEGIEDIRIWPPGHGGSARSYIEGEGDIEGLGTIPLRPLSTVPHYLAHMFSGKKFLKINNRPFIGRRYRGRDGRYRKNGPVPPERFNLTRKKAESSCNDDHSINKAVSSLHPLPPLFLVRTFEHHPCGGILESSESVCFHRFPERDFCSGPVFF